MKNAQVILLTKLTKVRKNPRLREFFVRVVKATESNVTLNQAQQRALKEKLARKRLPSVASLSTWLNKLAPAA